MLTGREGTLREREIKLESDNKLKEKKEENVIKKIKNRIISRKRKRRKKIIKRNFPLHL